jgi:UDP-glucose 4-epimerase
VRVLVTGGSGFIGSHVVERLVVNGHEPRIYDIVPPRHSCGRFVEAVIGDICDVNGVRRALRGCDAIVHLAAVADVNDAARDPSHADLVNARGTALLLQAAREEAISRVIYASTIWVYGNGAATDLLDEDALLPAPDHFYTATKLAGEMYCRAYEQLYGLEPTILRFGIPHGPRSREATVVATFVGRALDGLALRIMGDGTQARQFVYVEDLAEGVVSALLPHAAGRTYNLVGEEAVSVREVADIVRRLVSDVPIVHVPSRPADLHRAEISGARAWRELGWQPTVSFEEGVCRYTSWLAATNVNPFVATLASTDGSAAAVLFQEPGAL